MSAAVSRLRRGARRIAALVGAAAAVAALSVAAPGAVSGASASPDGSARAARTGVRAATADPHVGVSITAENAGVLAPGQDLVLAVTVANPAATASAPGTVVVWFDPKPQTSRPALAGWLSAPGPAAGSRTLQQAEVPALGPGTSTAVRVTVPAAAVPFAAQPAQSVYGIGASVTAGPASGDARGSLVWEPAPGGTPSQVGVVMPVISPSTGSGLISAADLATYTSANGVLTRDLDGLTGHSSVTVGVDPMIIASIRALGNAAPPTARDWLVRLREIPNDTFSLGFGDADVAGQVQSGLTAPLQPTSLAYALDPKNFTPTPAPIGEPPSPKTTPAPAGTPSPAPTSGAGTPLPTLAQLTAWDFSLSGIAWPGDASVRSADLGPLVQAGLSTTIVSGSNTNATSLARTPDAPLPVGAARLLVADQRLSDAVRQAASAPSDAAWNTAMSSVNAELMLTSTESGGPKRILVALDRSWPSSGTQLARTLASLLGTPWSVPASLADVSSATPTTGLSLTDAPEPQTRIDAIKALLQDEQALSGFSSILDAPERLTGRTRAELLTLLAVSWENPRTDWSGALTKSRAATVRTLHAVRILPTENVNLVSAQGSIPFTVSNELPDDPVNVVLTAAPSNSRLEIDQDATKRIPADSRATMLVPVKAKLGNGQVVLTLRLLSPTGVPIGDPSAVTVDVHADWEGIGAIILGVLLVLLFGFGIVRNILRRRAQRTPITAESDDDHSAVHADEDDPCG